MFLNNIWKDNNYFLLEFKAFKFLSRVVGPIDVFILVQISDAILLRPDNEVIVYRLMMYANPLLIVQAMYSTSKVQTVYYSYTWG